MTRDNTAELLDAVRTFILRYVVLRDDNQAVTLALWILHTHAIEAAVCTPYLSILSPEKQSGKTLLLEVLAPLTARAEHTSNISPAALFRRIEAGPPTMLLDEVDALFNSNGERAEALRGIINSGNRRGATVDRCHGPAHEVRSFKTFCPKVLAGIENGTLPDTVRDRSIAIPMRRKTRQDRVERWILQRTGQAARELHERVAGWAERYTETLTGAEPDLPEALTDRQQEAWWALLAIADLAGGTWPQAARNAAVALSSSQEDVSIGVRLLAAIRDLMAGRAALASAELLAALNADDELPFGGWSEGRGLDARGLARLLRRYDIRPGTIRLPNGSTPKGYKRDAFLDAWARYLPVPPQTDDVSPDPPQAKASNHGANGAAVGRVAAVADFGDKDWGTASTAEWAANADRPRACRCGGPENPEGNCMMCGLMVVKGVSR